MAEENELEKRAIEELLRETDRARVRAETMGPGGWLKCPLQGTNKRFLLNTLRSTGLQRHTTEPTTGHSARRGRLRSESPEERRGRSRSPPRDHRKNAGHTDHKHHHHRGKRSTEVKKPDRDWERSHRPDRGQAHSKDDQNTEQDKH